MTQTNILLEAGTNELEIVEFHLDEMEPDGVTPYKGFYGVNVAKVLEIIRLPKVTELPEGKDKSVLGAFNLRNQIIPLIDLSQWLGKKRSSPDSSAKVIVTEFNNVATAFMVSGVNRIHRISWENVDPPNAYISALTHNTITGVVKIEERIIFLLDLEYIVASLNPHLALRIDETVDWRSGRSFRALVADDSTIIRGMLKYLLQQANFEVEVVGDGKEAWARLEEIRKKSQEEGRPIESYLQCIVTDIEMPQMDGHNLCKRIKEDPILKRLPVILFSSLITDKLRHKGDSVGADAQISKPKVTQLAKCALDLITEKGFQHQGRPISTSSD